MEMLECSRNGWGIERAAETEERRIRRVMKMEVARKMVLLLFQIRGAILAEILNAIDVL